MRQGYLIHDYQAVEKEYKAIKDTEARNAYILKRRQLVKDVRQVWCYVLIQRSHFDFFFWHSTQFYASNGPTAKYQNEIMNCSSLEKTGSTRKCPLNSHIIILIVPQDH
jgi:hypothetical protein